ncbi:MAG: type II secretion system F family protein [Acidimicrobiales bacterium]|nr:type II secretion system F family protein [Acidimicrobiales bacterium]
MNGPLFAALIGAGLGAGCLLIIRALRPRPMPLAVAIRALDQPGRSVSTPLAPAHDDLRQRLGRSSARVMGALGLAESGALAEQLRALDKPIERHAYEKLLAATAGFALPMLAYAGLTAGGVRVSPMAPLIAAVVLAAGGFLYPDLPLAEQVEQRRQGFRHALSSWLDLVTIILAGGGGIETALTGAANAGGGWAFDEIRLALRRAELTGRPPWDLLDELGATLGVVELQELAASVRLAGGQGAKIRQSLAAKADALRAQQGADIETNAETRTEKMIVPVTVMVLGLTLFIGFGAIDAISTDGGATTFTPTAAQP